MFILKRITSHLLIVLAIFKIYLKLLGTKPIKNYVLVTAADKSHYRSLMQLLQSVTNHLPASTTIIYDLGLSKSQSLELKERFPQFQVRIFDYSQYPTFFNIELDAGSYAWKPTIISSVCNEFSLPVIWMDAGNVVTGSLKFERRVMKRYGVFTTVTSGTIEQWTHHSTLEYLGQKELGRRRELNGACVGFNNLNPLGWRILNDWASLALIKECIAPSGSNRDNHRQDQAVLSILIQSNKTLRKLYSKVDKLNWPGHLLGYKIHCDID